MSRVPWFCTYFWSCVSYICACRKGTTVEVLLHQPQPWPELIWCWPWPETGRTWLSFNPPNSLLDQMCVVETFENTHRKKSKWMQSIYCQILLVRRFEDTSENTQWRKVKQMQPMWACTLWGRPFEETSKHTQLRKVLLHQLRPL